MREREALQQIADQQRKSLAVIRDNGFIFTDIGQEKGNWQHLAFTLYTDICEMSTLAESALAEDQAEWPTPQPRNYGPRSLTEQEREWRGAPDRRERT